MRGLVIPEGHVDQDNIFIAWVSVDYDYIADDEAGSCGGTGFFEGYGDGSFAGFYHQRIGGQVALAGTVRRRRSAKRLSAGDSKTGKKGHVIGVIKDFNFDKLDKAVGADGDGCECAAVQSVCDPRKVRNVCRRRSPRYSGYGKSIFRGGYLNTIFWMRISIPSIRRRRI